MNKGEHEAALPLLRQALAESPGDAVVHNSYGSALAATGHLADAVAQYRKATVLSPDYPDAHNNLASALVQSGRPDEAIAAFEKALALKPDFAEAHSGLGGVLAQKGRVSAAVPHLLEAVELGPQNPMARTNLCLALSMAGRAQEAIPHAQEAVALTKGQDPLVLDLLGRLNAQAGRLPEAIEATRQALELASLARDQPLVRDLRARLSSYEAAVAAGPREPGRSRSR
jgi:Flp pilus assembly protein TadD